MTIPCRELAPLPDALGRTNQPPPLHAAVGLPGVLRTAPPALRTPFCPPQIRRSVLDGKRPLVPAQEALPGAEGDAFTHLATYIQLME